MICVDLLHPCFVMVYLFNVSLSYYLRFFQFKVNFVCQQNNFKSCDWASLRQRMDAFNCVNVLPSSVVQDTGGNISCHEAAKERGNGSRQTWRKVSVVPKTESISVLILYMILLVNILISWYNWLHLYFFFSRDAKAASHFRQKVMAIKAHLSQLQEREKDIQQKLHHKKNHRKLTVF